MKLRISNYLLGTLFIYACLFSTTFGFLKNSKEEIQKFSPEANPVSEQPAQINKLSTKMASVNEATTEPEVFNFTVPKNTTKPCLKVIMAASFNIIYSVNDGTNNTVKFNMQDLDDYTGECAKEFNLLEINFRKNWILKLNYTVNLNESTYYLDTIKLDYMVEPKLFPNVSNNDIGKKTAELNNNTHYSTKVGNSYRCTSNQTLKLNDFVTMEISNYHAQPFITFDTSTKDFDTAVNCTADLFTTTKLVPIIVGSALVILVVLVLVAYIIGRRKHRPGYQQV